MNVRYRNVSYHKQVARRHLCNKKTLVKAGGVVEPVDIFLSFSLITEFGRSRSDSMGVRRDPKNLVNAVPPPLGMGSG